MKNLLLFCFSIVFTFLIIELFLRLIPVADATYIQSVNKSQPYMHFRQNRDITWSHGWNFSIQSKKHINNYGYMSNIDYKKTDENVIAVIGDSYVEAMQVDNNETFHHIFGENTNNTIYAVGTSGSPLSQYLAYAKFIQDEFNSGKVIFTIIANDFDESMYKYKKSAGHHYFKKDENNNYFLKRIDYKASQLKHMLRESYLVRYLFINVGIKKIKYIFNQDTYSANTVKYGSEERVEDSKLAIDLFFKELKKLNFKNENILFVIDGNRQEIYNNKEDENAYFSIMRKYFMNEAIEKQYAIVDLNKVFKSDWEKNKKRFESTTDWHWNEYGHSIVSKAIENILIFNN